jgi:hypothetical protein
MTERLLELFEPRGVGRPAKIAGWVAGGLVGSIIAIAALLVLLSSHIGA